MQEEQNVMIEFDLVKQAIENNRTKELIDELDVLIYVQKKVFVWSKNYTQKEMTEYCNNTKIELDKKEEEDHLKCFTLRNEGLTYDEIAEKTGVDIKIIGFYVNIDPTEGWYLKDWITSALEKKSENYQKADIIIDNDEKFIKKFQKIGITSRLVDQI